MPLTADQLRKVTFTFWGWCALLATAVVLHFSDVRADSQSCEAVDCQYKHTQEDCNDVVRDGTRACVWGSEFQQCTVNCTLMFVNGTQTPVRRDEKHCEELEGSCIWNAVEGACTELDIDSATIQQLIGIAIEFVGTTLSVIGLNGQKWALMRTKGHHVGEPDGANICVRAWHWLLYNWRWAVAFAIFTSGQIIISAALNFGTQAVLTTITALSVVTNAIIAHQVFGKPFTTHPTEKFGPKILRGWDLGCCITIILGVGMCAFGAPDPPHNLIVIPDEACPDTDVFRSYFEGLIFLFWFLRCKIALRCG